MTTDYTDPSTWRLTTGGGIPYRYLDMSGSFETETAAVTVSVLIEASQLIPFMTEVFPPPIQIGAIAIPQRTSLAGAPGLSAQRANFSAFDTSLPIDPLVVDSGAPEGTYFPLVKVDVEYGPNQGAPQEQINENDPFTFLEISADASGSFLHVPSVGGKWQPETEGAVADDNADTEQAFNGTVFANNERLATDDGEPVPNKHPNAPINLIIPETSWNIRWNQIPFFYFQQVLLPRIRHLMGKVNEFVFPVLHYATKETLLFNGYSYEHVYTWRDGYTTTPPININMKIMEKRVNDDGKILGHNHFWQPGIGWTRYKVDGVNPAYELANFNLLFSK